MQYRPIGICAGILAAIIIMADASASVTVKKDGTGDYTTITAALGELTAAEIVVYPGVYQETITISRPVVLRSYEGPNLTCIDGIARPSSSVVTVAASIVDVRLSGFRIARGYDGVYVSDHAEAEVCNCIIDSNSGHGIEVYSTGGTITNASIYNNVIYGNTRAGIYLNANYGAYTWRLMYCKILNNIILKNTAYGLAASTYNSPERVTVAYNDLYLNMPFDTDSNYGTSSGVVLGPGMLSTDPQFVGANTNDVRLLAASPCRDKGSPSEPYNDPDGTTDDMGAFGGPYSATFYESPTDGPIVREVAVTPGSVVRGGTFTIQATVAVR